MWARPIRSDGKGDGLYRARNSDRLPDYGRRIFRHVTHRFSRDQGNGYHYRGRDGYLSDSDAHSPAGLASPRPTKHLGYGRREADHLILKT